MLSPQKGTNAVEIMPVYIYGFRKEDVEKNYLLPPIIFRHPQCLCRRVAVRGSQSWTPGALCRETRPPHWLRFPSRLRTPEPGGLLVE
jgi:hypothetical protein